MAKQSGKAAAVAKHEMPAEAMVSALLVRNLPLISRSTSFAKMVRADIRSIPNFKDLHWLFPPLCHRKDQAALTDVERSRFLCAFNMINSDGTLGCSRRSRSEPPCRSNSEPGRKLTFA